MYLYVGDGKYKKLSEIIGIFDMDSATVCVASRRFLSAMEREGRMESDGELPKSFILCDERDKKISFIKNKRKCETSQKKDGYVYLSKLASGVLVARTARIKDEITEE